MRVCCRVVNTEGMGSEQSAQGHLPQPVSSESVSILKHPFNPGIHFSFVDKLAPRNLI
jgi:hypothetical protein